MSPLVPLSPLVPIRARDALGAFAIALLAFAFYLGHRQEWLLQDGAGLVVGLLYREPEYWMHVAILPLARALQPFCPAEDPSLALSLVSAAGAALGLGACYALMRRLGASVGAGLLACALAASSPALFVHATLIEVHALHFGAVALGALATSYLVHWSPLRALVGLALVAFALHATHRTAPLLLPGWVVWTASLRQRVTAGTAHGPNAPPHDTARAHEPSAQPHDARSFSRGALAQFALPALGLGLGLLLAILASAALRGSEPVSELLADQRLVRSFGAGFSARFAWREGLVPLGLVLPLALLAWFAQSATRSRTSRLALPVLVLPSAVFFLWWGEATQGGYALGVLPFFALEAAQLEPRARAARVALRLLALAAIAAQLALGRAEVRSHVDEPGYGTDARERAAAFERALGGGGSVLALEPCLVPAHLYGAHVREYNLAPAAIFWAARGETPEQIAQRLLGPVHAVVEAEPGAVLVHLGVPAGLEAHARYPAALRAACEQRFETRYVPDARHPALVLLRVRGAGS